MKSESQNRGRYWQILLGVFLIVLSTIGYAVHYLLFRDLHHIFIFLVGDIAFVFLEVLLVTMVIHQVLEEREKRSRLNKLNVVIGVFFSEMGTSLIKALADLDSNNAEKREKLMVRQDWTDHEFKEAEQWLTTHKYHAEIGGEYCEKLRDFLLSKRTFLLRLLGNPNLLEHESFTEMLRTVFHLAEELEHRPQFKELPLEDYQHLAGDVKRVYSQIVPQWIAYMKHLKVTYPYLFSLAMRRNPFDDAASPVLNNLSGAASEVAREI